MTALSVELLTIRYLISFVGLVGNVVLISSICNIPRLKTFEILLLGLAISNLEGILIVDIYDVIIIVRTSALPKWMCTMLKYLTMFGEVSTILFTTLISIFRYQKLRDAEKRVNLPVPMDSISTVMVLSGGCMLVAIAFGIPIYFSKLDSHLLNMTTSNTNCPPDFFQCPKGNCPIPNLVYKYMFLLLIILLPVCIVTVTSSHILRILLVQRRVVAPPQAHPSYPNLRNRKTSSFQRSTIAVLTAMTIFQVDWIVYLALHLALDPYLFPSWGEVEFFITTSYSTVSPYVYGTGNNLFSLKQFVWRGR